MLFLKRWVLFVFTWWQLNNPAVREFRGVSVDAIRFLPVFLGWWRSAELESASWLHKEGGE